MADAIDTRIAPMRAPRGGRRYFHVVRTLVRPRIKHVFLLGATMSLIDYLRIWPQLPAGPHQGLAAELLTIPTSQAAAVVLAVTLVQATSLARGPRFACMLAAALITAGAAATIAGVIFTYTDFGYFLRERVLASTASFVMSLAWEFTAIGVAASVFYMTQERESQLASSAREAELERVEKQRAVMESRLAVLRARVEPEFLFAALDEVHELYRKDRHAADAMVDALIVYLRAALPQMRGEASTVQREVELARAYVAVLQASRAGGLAVTDDVEDNVRDVVLPPMVLLPLTQAAFARADVDRNRRFEITAGRSPAGVAIRLTLAGGTRPEAWRNEGPRAPRRTLDAYFSDGATLAFGSEGNRHWSEVTLAPDAIIVQTV